MAGRCSSSFIGPNSTPEPRRGIERMTGDLVVTNGSNEEDQPVAPTLLVETDDPREMTELLQPYMDIINWDVHAVYEQSYEETVERFRQETA
jgi:hypothetical protein